MANIGWLSDIYGIRIGEDPLAKRDRVMIFNQVGLASLNSSDSNVDINNIRHGTGTYVEIEEDGENLELDSTSASDVGNLVIILGLDINGEVREQISIINGITPVNVGVWTWIYRLTHLSPTPLNGSVRIFTNNDPVTATNIKAAITEGNRSKNICFKVPKNTYRAFVGQAIANMSRITGSISRNANLNISFSTKVAGIFSGYIHFSESTVSLTGNTLEEFKPLIPLEVKPETKLKWVAESVSDNGTSVTAILQTLVILDKPPILVVSPNQADI